MWNYIYNPVEGLIQQTASGLQMHGNEVSLGRCSQGVAGTAAGTLLLCCRSRPAFYTAAGGEEAGLTVYMNPAHHYEIARTMRDGRDCVILRRRIGGLCAVEQVLPYSDETMTLRLECDRDRYRFSFRTADGTVQPVGSGETQYLTTEAGGCFTGNYIALYASGNGKPMTTTATFPVSLTSRKQNNHWLLHLQYTMQICCMVYFWHERGKAGHTFLGRKVRCEN